MHPFYALGMKHELNCMKHLEYEQDGTLHCEFTEEPVFDAPVEKPAATESSKHPVIEAVQNNILDTALNMSLQKKLRQINEDTLEDIARSYTKEMFAQNTDVNYNEMLAMEKLLEAAGLEFRS